jgi:hypothetical protein
MEGNEPPILDYDHGRAPKWIVIAQFPDEITAHLASSKLDAEGIRTNLGNEQNPISGSNSTAIAVQTDDVKAAIAILKDSPAKRWLVDQEA